MYFDSTREDVPLNSDETFSIATVHEFGRNIEPLGFDYPWDVEPTLGSLEPSNSRPTTEEEDGLRREEHLANADLSRTDTFGLSDTTLQSEDLQSVSLCISCKTEQVQTMTVPCRHLTVCERCSESILICPLCHEIIEGTVRIFVGFSMKKRLYR